MHSKWILLLLEDGCMYDSEFIWVASWIKQVLKDLCHCYTKKKKAWSAPAQPSFSKTPEIILYLVVFTEYILKIILLHARSSLYMCFGYHASPSLVYHDLVHLRAKVSRSVFSACLPGCLCWRPYLSGIQQY